ncbi:MAG: hypothetical protein NVS4B2_05130 [Chloroflexota bacterium]
MIVGHVRRLIVASPPLLVGLLTAKLWLTGTLGYYVNDRTVWIVLFGGVLFLAVGAATVTSALRRSHDIEPLSWRTVVFVVPVLVGLVLPARPLSAASGQSSSLGALQLASHISSGSGGDEFGTWVAALANHPDPAWWAGRHVTLVGFVSHQVGLPARSMIVGRYLVTCCVVDATMFGFPVQIDHGEVPAQGGWIQVSGTFGRRYWTDPSGQQYPIVEHARLARVTIPSSPYLSP